MTETTHTPLPELLPCPFCGGHAIFVGNGVNSNVFGIVHCYSQDCLGYHWPDGEYGGCTHATSKAEAIAAWNTRSDSHHRLVEALEALISATGEHDWNCSIGALYNCTCDLHDAKERARAALKEAGRG